jgi:phosphatidylinositol alpha-mannosyltransferase
MPKIIHVSSTYLPVLGGMEKVVQTLANMQAKSGLEVSVMTSNQKAKNYKSTDIFPVGRLKSYVILKTTIIPSLLPKLLQVRSSSIVHLHITQAYMPEIVWLTSKIKGFAYIAHIHIDIPPSSIAGMLLIPYKRFILRRVLLSAAYVVVFSNEQKETAIKKFGLSSKKVVVIPNGVDEKFFYNEKRLPHKKTRLLFVGRLSLQKNLFFFLNALNGISDNFQTTLVGDGELEDELKQFAKDLKLKNIYFVGRANGQKLINYYKRSDVFILTSEREGMPLVLLEAMAMALPIVATNVVGIRDVVINRENGYLVRQGDLEELQEALKKIDKDRQSYIKFSKTSRKLSNSYSWPSIDKSINKLYESVVR